MKTTRRTALMLFASTALGACGAPAIVTRDKSDPFEGGIGGTGIVGTLNGFGSLLVNGVTVELEGDTVIRSAFGPLTQDAFAPGQMLTVSAIRTPDRILARDVVVDYALIGTLRQTRAGTSVNGVPLIASQSALTHASTGVRVAVSGTWTPMGVRPNRIDPAPHELDLIAGTSDDKGIAGVEIDARGPAPALGSYAVAIGRAADGGLRAERVETGRFARLERLQNLSVEGYLEPSVNAPGFRIAGLGHNFARSVRLSEVGARRAIYFGRYNGLFGARRGYIVPDEFAARSRLLTPGLDETFAGPVLRV
ncbi:MAG: DUF5666 domain-containing protein [Pseudomonadota bacterium]